MKQTQTIKVPGLLILVGAVLFLALTTSAHAGGLADGTAAATTFKTWIYGFVGICAVIFLLCRIAMAWANKIQWIDLAFDIAKVAAAGSVLVLAPWAWGIFA
jgi:hypothetical protein